MNTCSREVIANFRYQKNTPPGITGSVMLAYGCRDASNVVYGNSLQLKVQSAADFFSFLLHAAMMSGCHYLWDVCVG